jgi:hypothetical protein
MSNCTPLHACGPPHANAAMSEPVNRGIGDSTITNSPIPAFANYCLMVLYVGNFGRTSFFGGFFSSSVRIS